MKEMRKLAFKNKDDGASTKSGNGRMRPSVLALIR